MSQFDELYNKPREVNFSSSGTLTTTTEFDVNAVLGRNAIDGYVINDGSNSFSVSVSDVSNSSYGNNILLKAGEVLNLKALSIDTIKLTHTANSDYRIFAI